MEGFQVHITGRVQGVGFRPFVYNLAKTFHLEGTVKNTSKGVFIELIGDIVTIEKFVAEVQKNSPAQSVIEGVAISPYDVDLKKSGFHIIESGPSNEVSLKISPDFATCPRCLEELAKQGNRRADYAFITCSECGPRYSIQYALPYDRINTTMVGFQMCEQCDAEYSDPTNRRFYSQTNSCPECGVQLQLSGKGQTFEGLTQHAILDIAIQALRRGNILAVKGIGGYLLVCDSCNEESVKTLRSRKQRPDKPLAVLYPSLESIRSDALVSEEEAEWLQNEVSPIVLLKRKTQTGNPVCWDQVTPGLTNVGGMLPYAPVLKLLTDGFEGPLVATSGNISGGPIIYDDQDVSENLMAIADLVVGNNRQILIPQDDSVLRVVDDERVWLRRSRGLAPSYFGSIAENSQNGILALGAHMKSSFTLSQSNNWHISQYLGTLDSFEAQQTYQHTVDHIRGLFNEPLNHLLSDKHPSYFTHTLAGALSSDLNVSAEYIQHHEAHFAAILQEHDLIDSNPVLGVIWDGTGYGDDGAIWGGEFFSYESFEMSRSLHLNYVPIIANDKMAREPRISALSFCATIEGAEHCIRKKFSAVEWKNYQKQASRPLSITSSVGRLFDAVASFIGLIDLSTYEGQAAMMLEECASHHEVKIEESYPLPIIDQIISTNLLFEEILKDLQVGKSPSFIAMRFHVSLVDLIRRVAEGKQIDRLAFSGGVFQNALLVSLIKDQLSEDFQLHFHKHLPPNDENISFGQMAHYHMQLMRHEFSLKNKDYVSSNPW